MANATGYDLLEPSRPTSSSVSRVDNATENTIYVFDPTTNLRNFLLTGGTSDGDNIAINGLSNSFKVKTKGNTITLKGIKNTESQGVQVRISMDKTGGTDKLWFADGSVEVTFTPNASGKGGSWTIGGNKIGKKADLSKLDFTITESETFAAAETAAEDGIEEGSSETFVLTTGQDVLAGTAGNDTFNAAAVNILGQDANTLQAFDSIDGGAGTDTLNIYVKEQASGDGYNAAQVGTVKNVEIINIYNTEAGDDLFGNADGAVDASKFEGATQVWQIDDHADVVKLGNGTTAGFRNVEAGRSNQIYVETASTATTANVALDGVVVGASSDRAWVNAEGAALNTVNISGTVVANPDTNTDRVPALDLEITAGKNVQTVTVNTSFETRLSVSENSATDPNKQITTVNAAGSLGGIEFSGDSDVSSITTGSGNDEIFLNTNFTTTVKTATAVTGAGDDFILVQTDNTDNSDAIVGTKVVVDAGAGADEIVLKSSVADSGVDVNAGAGDDTVEVLFAQGLADVDGETMVIDGGEGTDTIIIAGKTLDGGDYDTFANVIKNFEAVEFTGSGDAVVDASRMAAYNDFTFAGNAGDKITKVAANDVLTTKGDLTAVAAGYTAATATAATVYAGSLDITATGGEGVITASAETLNLEVKSKAGDPEVGSGDNAYAWLQGDLKTATITLTNAVTVDEDGEVVADHVAGVWVQTVAAKDAVLGDNPATSGETETDFEITPAVDAQLMSLTTLTLKGDGYAQVFNVDKAKLATVDASDLGGVFSVDAMGNAKGDPIPGLFYVTENNTTKETITLGAGEDFIVISEASTGKFASTAKGAESGFTGMDTITGFNLVEDADVEGAIDSTSDRLVLDVTLVDNVFAKATVSQTLALGTVLNSLALDADATDSSFVFEYKGNTYIYSDIDSGSETNTLTDNDLLIKLTGTYDLDLLLTMINPVAP